MKQTFRKIGSRYNASIVGIVFLLLTTSPSTARAQSAGSFTATGNMTTARAGHTATLLRNGKVLIAGGASTTELYDPFTKTFTLTGSMTTFRSGQTATLLNDGKVLIAGGAGTNGITLNSAELYDPLTGSFARVGNMISARWGHTSTLLNDGRVLIAGGIADASFTSAEIYNPSTATFAKAGDMIRPRSGHTATLLNDGRVLIAGVYDDRSGAESEDELYDPSTGRFSRNRVGIGVHEHTATLLIDGRVLFVGGSIDTAGEYAGATLYEPSTDSYFATGVMIGPTGPNVLSPHGRAIHTATLLSDGRVLVAGGVKVICDPACHQVTSDASTEIYDPVTRIFSSSGKMTVPRSFHTATLLSDGTVLITGGANGPPYDFGSLPTASAEIYISFADSIGPPQPGIITTYAGASPPVDGGQAIDYALDQPLSVASDGAGGLYVASDRRVYRVNAGGQIRAVAGNGTFGSSGDGGLATSAQFGSPDGLAVDTVGNVYIADCSNNRIRKVTLDGVIQTVAGNGTYGFSGDGGPATSAQLSNQCGVAVDSFGNLYIYDVGNSRVRRVAPNGVIQTVAGNGAYGFSGDGGPATSAQLWGAGGIATDMAGNLYIADGVNNRIRKVSADGVIQTIAGNGSHGFTGDGGLAASAPLENPAGIAVDSAGNLYILTSNSAFSSSGNNRIRKVTPDGVIQTVAGNGTIGFSGDGGSATTAQLSSSPRGVAIDAAGNIYLADTGNNRVRKVTSDGVIQTVAGNGSIGFSGDGGQATSSLFNFPVGVAVDAVGNLYIADSSNNRVRKVTPGGVISTVAGNGIAGFSGDGGAAASAQLLAPYGVAVDGAGNLYIIDTSNRIRKVTPDGVIRTIAGNGISGFSGDGGPATSASFSSGSVFTVNAAGDVYIVDNKRIRKVTPDGAIQTVFAGVSMWGVAVDAIGNLYVGDFENNAVSDSDVRRIRTVTPGGVIRTLYREPMGYPLESVSNEDIGKLYLWGGIVVDAIGNLYSISNSSGPVLKITPAGVVSTVAGVNIGSGGDGGLSTLAQFRYLRGIAVDPGGNLFITDDYRIRKIEFGLSVFGVTPSSAARGAVVQVSMSGSRLDSSLVINPIDGIAVSNLTLVSPNAATAIFTIAADAVPGARSVSVTTSNGTSNTFKFTVNPPPSLTLLAPPVGVLGTSVVMTLLGTGFAGDLFVDTGSEITVSNITVTSSTSAVATFTISSSALLGAHDVTVTTTNGTSAPAAFNVVLPFPDLTITSTHATNFGVGFTETYNILVRNVGLLPTTGVVTITDVLPSGFAYSSGGGVAWSCSAAGQAVTCVHSGTLGPDESSPLDIAVAVSNAAAPGVVHAISVATPGDVNPSNDSSTDLTTVVPTPVPIFIINPSPIRAGSQATLGLTLTNAFPHDVTGEVTMGFSSNAAIPLDDPALQFASGGRQTTFVIPANTLQARIGGNSAAGPLGFQVGTVAGALSFSGTLQAGTVQTTISPSSSVASSLTIPRQAPFIQDVETSTQNGFAVLIHLLSTSREVKQLSLTFNTTPAVTLSCGSVSGCTASGSTMLFDVRSLFDAWFSSDSVFGSLSTLHLPFSISGTVHGTVTVRFQNSMGVSAPKSFTLP